MENYLSTCGECPFFKHEDTDGNGWCKLRDLPNMRDAWCFFLEGDNDINIKQAERILHYHQKWRRYNGKKRMKMVNSTLLGRALDCALRVLRQRNAFIKKMCEHLTGIEGIDPHTEFKVYPWLFK